MLKRTSVGIGEEEGIGGADETFGTSQIGIPTTLNTADDRMIDHWGRCSPPLAKRSPLVKLMHAG
jgi:hypothetical protein